MEQMKQEDEVKQKAKQKAKQLKRIEEANSLRAMSTQTLGGGPDGEGSTSPSGKGGESERTKRVEPSRRLSAAISEMVGLGNPSEEKMNEASKMQRLMLGAWEGVDLTSMINEEPRKEVSVRSEAKRLYFHRCC